VRRSQTDTVRRVVASRLPTEHGDFLAVGFVDQAGGHEHLAFLFGDVSGDEPVLTRVHSECFTGDVMGCLRCECGQQLSAALQAVAAQGRGVVLYVRGHEGRGIGLFAKLEAHRLQDEGLDTVDANLALGLPVDARDYGVPAAILTELGIKAVRLLSNNPKKRDGLVEHGIHVTEQVPLLIEPGPLNLGYLRTKRARLNHHLPQLDRKK